MKILIINSPLFEESNALYDEDSLPPIGLGLIATALKRKGNEVELIDAVADRIPLKELVRMVHEKRPEYIGTNVFTTNLELVQQLVQQISYPTHFIIGALSTKNLYEHIFNWESINPIDVVQGDGELIISDIVAKQLQQAPVVQKVNRRYFTVDKNSTYFVNDISTDDLDRSFFTNEPTIHPFGFKEANIVTSRGCIYNCAFCAAANKLNKEIGVREKSSESVIEEIRHLISIYPELQSIRVLDDLFLKTAVTVNKAIEIFKTFNLRWRSMAHVQTFRGVDESVVKELKNSGCDELFIGIESGSPKVLKEIHKTTDVAVIKENLSMLLRNGINVKGYFIYGFPCETREDFEMTFELAKSLKEVGLKHGSMFRTSVFQFRPYHGTELYHTLESKLGDSAFEKVSAVKPNKELSDLVGRLQFNFHSGNYSVEKIEVVQDYIYRTTNLNEARIYSLNGDSAEYFRKNKAV